MPAVTRFLIVLALALGAMVAVSPLPASADVQGAYDGATLCQYVGTNLITGDSPDKHGASGANSCETNYTIKVVQDHYDSAGRVIDECSAGYSTNYAQCSLQKTTLTGDY